jgi:hypothetical protein
MEQQRISLIRQDSYHGEAPSHVSPAQAAQMLRPALITFNSCDRLIYHPEPPHLYVHQEVDKEVSASTNRDTHARSSNEGHALRHSLHLSGHDRQVAHHALHIPHPHIHIHLPRPFLPIIHLILLSTHLGLSMTLPYILLSNLIQPMVLWLITLIPAILETLYLLPGLIMEIIGLIRCRPM